MSLPSKSSHDEDFIANYENQTNSLLTFYEIENIMRIEENVVKPMRISNGDYFSHEDKSAIKHFIKTLASNRTWTLLERNLNKIPDLNVEENLI